MVVLAPVAFENVPSGLKPRQVPVLTCCWGSWKEGGPDCHGRGGGCVVKQSLTAPSAIDVREV